MGVESREALDVKITYTVAEDRRPGASWSASIPGRDRACRRPRRLSKRSSMLWLTLLSQWLAKVLLRNGWVYAAANERTLE
jgi:hypothetical protein